MGSYKRPRVFDPLDLETIHLVYEAEGIRPPTRTKRACAKRR